MTRSTAVAALLSCTALLAGCGIRDPYAATANTAETQTTPASTPPIAAAAAVRAAERYARAARSSSANTAAANYHRQVELAADPLRAALLRAGAPAPRELDAQRAARARTVATVVATTTRTAAASSATLTITLRERHVETGLIDETQTRNTARLRRAADGHWKVTAFTADP